MILIPAKYEAEYRASLKSSDTEEHIDLAFYRPLGFAWALLFRKLHITPNAVTIASIFIGVAAGICFYPENLLINIAGIILLVWANSYDSADGQLARMTKQYSQLGRILDGMAGDFWFISIYVAICLRTIDFGCIIPALDGHSWAVWVIAAAAGVCHAWQAAAADNLRQFHLYFVKKDFPSELDDADAVKEQYSQARGIRKLILLIYYRYTASQQKSNPSMQQLLAILRRRYPNGKLPADLAERIRVSTLPLCKWENFLTFNWRSITLFITVLAGVPFVYFLVELTVFNIVMVYARCKHEKICKTYINELSDADK